MAFTKARITIDRFRLVQFPRFSGALLIQKGSQDDIRKHLQKFAFPVLHRCFHEAVTGDVFKISKRWLRVLLLFLVVVVLPDYTQPDLEENEQPE